MKKNMPLARKIYWNLSLVSVAFLYAGMLRRHQAHEEHGTKCRCMPNCLGCAYDGLRGRS